MDKVKFYILVNYPTFYGKDIYTLTGTSVVAEFNAMIDRDDKLRAYLMAKKEPMMFNITRFETYLLYRDSLIAVLKSSLDE